MQKANGQLAPGTGRSPLAGGDGCPLDNLLALAARLLALERIAIAAVPWSAYARMARTEPDRLPVALLACIGRRPEPEELERWARGRAGDLVVRRRLRESGDGRVLLLLGVGDPRTERDPALVDHVATLAADLAAGVHARDAIGGIAPVLTQLATTFDEPVSRSTVLDTLAQWLAASVGADYAFLAEAVPGAPSCGRMLASWGRSARIPLRTYDMEGTPCFDVRTLGACWIGEGAASRYPTDTLLEQLGIECFAGTELPSSPSRPASWLAIMHPEPLDRLCVELALRAFAVRVAAELDRAAPVVTAATRQLGVELRRALDSGEFVLHFQPIWRPDASLAAVEALVRWRRPGAGLVYPSAFLREAEITGVMKDLGRWALGEACREGARLRSAGLRNVRIAVNVSAAEFHDDDLEPAIVQSLAAAGLDPDALILEITEGIALHDCDDGVARISRLRERGIGIFLDDFGTGYSSLSQLCRLPFDALKIDRSFIAEMDESEDRREIVNAIVRLAERLRVPVVAEGIESERQLAAMKELGCSMFQGYLLGQPQPASRIEAMMRNAFRGF